jgi:hypothetical protein
LSSSNLSRYLLNDLRTINRLCGVYKMHYAMLAKNLVYAECDVMCKHTAVGMVYGRV